MKRNSRLTPAFTMVELLTVIAIIALLAAIAFPVFSAIRKNARRTACMSNLQRISQAVEQYKLDYRVYPGALYGYYQADDPSTPASWVGRTFLYPQYIKDRSVFHCPNHPVDQSADVTAGTGTIVWPNYFDPNPLATGVVVNAGGSGSPSRAYDAYYSYDVQLLSDVGVTPAAARMAYRVDWTGLPYDDPTLMLSGSPAGNWGPTELASSSPQIQANFARQLKYTNPPDSTVITMCPYHRDGSIFTPRRGSMDIVLFLSGRAQSVASMQTEVPGADGGEVSMVDPTFLDPRENATRFWMTPRR
jgi:prepilin-type N-terminal cleavage/methylation domain-containing protein